MCASSTCPAKFPEKFTSRDTLEVRFLQETVMLVFQKKANGYLRILLFSFRSSFKQVPFPSMFIVFPNMAKSFLSFKAKACSRYPSA